MKPIAYRKIGIFAFGFCILLVFVAGCLVPEYGTGRDIMIFKVDAGGTEEWQTVIDTGGDDTPKTIIQTEDGGYLVGGGVLPWRGALSYGIFKVDSNGSVVWNAIDPGNNPITSVAQTRGGTIVAMSGFRLLFYDQAGTLLGDDQGAERGGVLQSVFGTADGGFVVTGSARGDAQVIKRDQHLAEEWQKTFGDDGEDEAMNIIQTSDGGYLVSGITRPPERTDYDLWILRLNATGDLLWKTTLARTELYDDVDFMEEAPGGGCTVIYHYRREEEKGRYVQNLVDATIDHEGYMLKEKAIDAGRPIIKTPDGGYVSGNVTYHISYRYLIIQDQVGVPHIVKQRGDGLKKWDTALNTTFELIGTPVSVIQTSDGGYALLVDRLNFPEVPPGNGN